MSSDFSEFLDFMTGIEDRLPPVLDKLGAHMVTKTQRRFANNQVKGPPLRPYTIAEKGSSTKLVDTANLMNSLDYFRMDTYVMVGTSMKYGLFHQVGTKNVPKREWLFVNKPDVNELVIILMEGVFDGR